jgi:hypothetical protein
MIKVVPPALRKIKGASFIAKKLPLEYSKAMPPRYVLERKPDRSQAFGTNAKDCHPIG